MECPSCGATNTAAARFCSACGTVLADAATVGERKTVSVVFADLVESTQLAEGKDPEALASLLARFGGTMRSIVERHGGRVEKFIGDAVVGVFGVPTLHEDDALRAVRAALEMRDGAADLGLAIRVGINTGEVATGSGPRDALAVGHAVPIAARLEQAASPGGVLIGQATYALVGKDVVAEAIGELAVKGSTDAVRAWRVDGLRQPHQRGWQGAGPFIGRQSELQAIEAALANARSNQACVVVTVLAPPGMGKSRLAAEAATRVGHEIRVLIGRCVPYGEGVTYAPLIDIVQQAEAANGNLGLDELAKRAPDASQAIASLRATAAGTSRSAPEETAWAFRRLLELLAEDRPLLVVIEDLHWADPLLLDLLEYVMTFSAGSPMVLLALARPDLFDLRPEWATQRPNSTVLRLAPLTAGETADLIAALDGKVSDDETQRRIVEASGGVPLFAEQMAAFQTESGELLPPSIRALLAARVDRLGQAQKTVLHRAAVEGEVFRRATVNRLLPESSRAALGSSLMALMRRDFVRPERTPGGDDAFRFNHALIRDAVYESMPRRLRADLHVAYADLLAAAADDPGAQEVIGHHLEAAHRERVALGEGGDAVSDLGLRAAMALRIVARSAVSRKEWPRAVALLRSAQGLVAEQPAARLSLLPDLIDALVGTPDLDEADRVHALAVQAARELGDESAELRADLAWAHTEYMRDTAGWPARVTAIADRAIAHFEPLGDDEAIARAYLLEVTGQIGGGWQSRIAALERARLHAIRADDERSQIAVWDELGGAMLAGPTPMAEVVEFGRAEVAWARERGVAFTEADGLIVEAYGHVAQGEWEAGREAIARVQAIFAALPGLVTQYGESYNLAGHLERDAGNPAAAEPMYRRAMELFAKEGNRRWWRASAVALIHALIDQGRVADAQALLGEVEAQHFEPSIRSDAVLLAAKGRLMLATGDALAAVQLGRRAVEIIAGTGSLLVEAGTREHLAAFLAAAGDGEAARKELGAAHRLFVKKGYLSGARRTTRAPRKLTCAHG